MKNTLTFHFNQTCDLIEYIQQLEEQYRKKLPEEEYNKATTYYNIISINYINSEKKLKGGIKK
ncbi:MAG: hypothetical protein ACOC2U_00540 [bacterium]